MLNLLELEQLVAFADLGTLSRAAEALHISQPTITRTMQHIEDAFGVPLFVRGKNKIALNETGLQAVAYARNLLAAAQNAVQQVQAYHNRLHTIVVESCAPAPLWSLLPMLSTRFPEQTVSSKLSALSTIVDNVAQETCDIGILPYAISRPSIACIPIIRENLSICVPQSHELAARSALTFDDLNGFNCLLASQIGFWADLCYKKMPASKFIVQTEDFYLQELIQKSTLLCFTTNLADITPDIYRGRVCIPITDPEANVTYSFICRKSNTDYLAVAQQLQAKQALSQPDR